VTQPAGGRQRPNRCSLSRGRNSGRGCAGWRRGC
jgi:hypothetical protein